MKHTIAITTVFVWTFVSISAWGIDKLPPRDRLLRQGSLTGPTILAQADDYVIHMFRGFSITGSPLIMPRMVIQAAPPLSGYESGIALLHTDTKTGEARWIALTGLFLAPFNHVTYVRFRLMGIFQSESHMALVIYNSALMPTRPYPEDITKGTLRLYIVDKSSLSVSEGIELDMSQAGRFWGEWSNNETADIGIITQTKSGISVLGTEMRVYEDGRIEISDESQQSPAGDVLKAAPEE